MLPCRRWPLCSSRQTSAVNRQRISNLADVKVLQTRRMASTRPSACRCNNGAAVLPSTPHDLRETHNFFALQHNRCDPAEDLLLSFAPKDFEAQGDRARSHVISVDLPESTCFDICVCVRVCLCACKTGVSNSSRRKIQTGRPGRNAPEAALYIENYTVVCQ